MTREFRLAKGRRISAYICLPILIAIFIYIGDKKSASGTWLFIPLSIVVLASCVWGLINCIKGQLIITDDRVIQVGAFKTKELPFSMIKGFTSDGKHLKIQPLEEGFPEIRVNTHTEKTEELKEVLAGNITDLDRQSFEQEEKQILSDEWLGTTKGERSEKLDAARNLARTLNVIGYISGLWLMLFPNPYQLAVVVALLFPLAILFALHRIHAGKYVYTKKVY